MPALNFSAKSAEAEKLGSFLRNELNCAALPPDAAIGIKPMTEKAQKRLIRRAIKYALGANCPA